MAEIFGTAASVLQVAEVGFSLATTLYKYAASVKGAEKEIKKIARDVKLTSKVLERTHAQLKADQQAQLCTDDALYDLEEVLEGCKEAFQEVDSALSKTLKPGPDGKVGISTFEKLKWPFRNDKLEVLRANLEKLKTTLLLMLSVLAYGSKISQNRTEHTNVKVELTLEKLQIQNLVQAKDEATQRYKELSAAFQKLETRISNSANPIPRPESYTSSLFSMPRPQTPGFGTTFVPDPSTSVSSRLSLCTTAVSKLTISIEAATKLWESSKILEDNSIRLSLNETTQAVHALQKESSGNHALQDYQMQMMLLEQQNKKRLLMARQEQDFMVQQQAVQAQVSQQQTQGHLTPEQQEQLRQQREQQRQLQIQAMAQQRCFTGRQQQQTMQMAQQQQQQQQQNQVQGQPGGLRGAAAEANFPALLVRNYPMPPSGSQMMPSQNTQQRQQQQTGQGRRERSRSRSRSRSRRRHWDRPRIQPEESSGDNTPLGVGGGAIVGDAIFPGLGTVGGALVGGLGAYEYGKKRTQSSPSRTTRHRSYNNGSPPRHGDLPDFENPRPAAMTGNSLPAALLQQYPALANVDPQEAPPVPIIPAHSTSLSNQVGELQDSGNLNLDQDLGTDGPRLKKSEDDEERFDAMGNKIESIKKQKKLLSAELRKKKKDRMARRKRGEEVFSDEDEDDFSYEEVNAAGTFDFSGVDLEYISDARSKQHLSAGRHPADMNDRFGSMDFASVDSGDVVDHFDFDSFLTNTAGDESLSFNADVGYEHHELAVPAPDISFNQASTSYPSRPLPAVPYPENATPPSLITDGKALPPIPGQPSYTPDVYPGATQSQYVPRSTSLVSDSTTPQVVQPLRSKTDAEERRLRQQQVRSSTHKDMNKIFQASPKVDFEVRMSLSPPNPSSRRRGRAKSDMQPMPEATPLTTGPGGLPGNVKKRRRGSSSEKSGADHGQISPEVLMEVNEDEDDKEEDEEEGRSFDGDGDEDADETESEEDDDNDAVNNLLKRWTKVSA